MTARVAKFTCYAMFGLGMAAAGAGMTWLGAVDVIEGWGHDAPRFLIGITQFPLGVAVCATIGYAISLGPRR